MSDRRSPLIICDQREERSGIPARLRGHGAIVEVAQLACDYLVSAAFALERKAPRDLVDSIANRRLLAQLDQLSREHEYGALLIEGDAWEGDRQLHSPQLGELYHWLSLRPNLTLLYSPSPRWSALILLDLARREQFGRFATAAAPARASQRTARTPRDVLLALPGVGDRNADRLLTHFGSLRALVNASREDLSAVVGATRGARLHALLRGDDQSQASNVIDL